MASSIPSAKNVPDFGQRYAILNLDWMRLMIGAVQDTPDGQALIANYAQWNNAVHQKDPRPLSIFTTLSFKRGQPEVESNKPFGKLIAPFGTLDADDPGIQIDDRFAVDEKDVMLSKTRWAATTGSTLEQILRAQNIDTVIISGLTLSGVVMGTIYRLFDLDCSIYVIGDNVVDLPVE